MNELLADIAEYFSDPEAEFFTMNREECADLKANIQLMQHLLRECMEQLTQTKGNSKLVAQILFILEQ